MQTKKPQSFASDFASVVDSSNQSGFIHIFLENFS